VVWDASLPTTFAMTSLGKSRKWQMVEMEVCQDRRMG